jgi:hypothetical protein
MVKMKCRFFCEGNNRVGEFFEAIEAAQNGACHTEEQQQGIECGIGWEGFK